MKKKADLEEKPLLNIDLTQVVVIVLSVVVGALISLYVNVKYGPTIIQNFSDIQSAPLLDIIGTSVLYLFLPSCSYKEDLVFAMIGTSICSDHLLLNRLVTAMSIV